MTISVAERAPGRGVVVADIDLQPRPAGHRAGARRNGGIRLRGRLARRARRRTRTSISSSGTRTSRRCRRYEPRSAGRRTRPADAATIGRDQDGTKVLSAYQTIEPLGWRVFVEEPLSEAFAPLEVGDLAHRAPARRVPAARGRDRRPARPQARPADRVDPGRGGEDRLGRARPADRDHEQRRARRARRGVQPHGRAAPGVLRGPRAEGRGADAGARDGARASSTRRAASSRPRAGTSRSSWRTCRTSCGRR